MLRVLLILAILYIRKSCNKHVLFLFPGYARNGPNYYGTMIGPLQQYAHGIKGTVYAVDDATIFIKGFSYDGTGPDAYFWVGNTTQPNPDGYIVPYPESDSSR